MRKIIFALTFTMLFALNSFAQDGSDDPHHLFFKGNSLYEKRDYEKAVEEYVKILDAGIESGCLYYNIGNAFFKIGKIGYAILSYKKAQKLIPSDSDLKSNLSFAQSLTEDSSLQPQLGNRLAQFIKIPFREFNLNTVAIMLVTFYLMLIAMIIAGLINSVFRRRATFFFYILLILFLITLAAFSVRYYDEEAMRHGIVVAKEAECKYEPIDKSTTYFTLKEGQEAVILKTRNGWRRIKRIDGKLGWVKSDAVEEID